jgi:hypothetical protein
LGYVIKRDKTRYFTKLPIMKCLLLLALSLPLLSRAQSFNITEQAGYSVSGNPTNSGTQMSGFSNQVSVGFHPVEHLSVSVFYGFNSWDTRNTSYGLAPDVVFKHFYAGVDIALEKYADYYHFPVTYSYNNSLGLGVHAGARQKIVKHLSVVEQVGYLSDKLTGTTYSDTGGPPTAVSGKLSDVLSSWYVRAGLSVRL